MALAAVKTWNPGDTLTAADLNSLNTNILNNPISLISPTTGAINFQTSVAHTNLAPSALTASSGTLGNALIVSSSGTSLWGAPAARVMSGVSGLTGTLSSQTGTFTAIQYLLRTTAGTSAYVLNSTDQFVVNIGTAGPAANGRDVAGAFASTYVHWYAITTGYGSTAAAGLVSSTPPPTGPTMPTSYSAWCYLGGSPYTSASTTVVGPHYFRNSRAHIVNPAGDFRVLSAGTGTSSAAGGNTQIVLASALPINASMFQVLVTGIASTTVVEAHTINFGISSTFTTADPMRFLQWNNEVAGVDSRIAVSLDFPNVSQGLYYINASSGLQTTVDLFGYSMPNGDAA